MEVVNRLTTVGTQSDMVFYSACVQVYSMTYMIITPVRTQSTVV